jgi:hypothetical protein
MATSSVHMDSRKAVRRDRVAFLSSMVWFKRQVAGQMQELERQDDNGVPGTLRFESVLALNVTGLGAGQLSQTARGEGLSGHNSCFRKARLL